MLHSMCVVNLLHFMVSKFIYPKAEPQGPHTSLTCLDLSLVHEHLCYPQG